MPFCCNGYQDTDIMWAVNYIKQFKDSQENDFKDALDEYMNKYFNSFMMNAIYNEETETITLQQELIADGIHVYNQEERSITIE